MTVEAWLVLEFVPAKTPGERVVRPDARPAGRDAGFVDGAGEGPLVVRWVTQVERGGAFDDAAVASEHGRQDLAVLLVRHPVARDLELVLGVALVIDVIGRVGKHQ